MQHTWRAMQGSSDTHPRWFGLQSLCSVMHHSAALWPHIGSYRVREDEDLCHPWSASSQRSTCGANPGLQELRTSHWLCPKPRLRCAPRAKQCFQEQAGAGSLPAARCVLGAWCTWPRQQHPASRLILCQPRTPTVVAQLSMPRCWSSCPGESTLG